MTSCYLLPANTNTMVLEVSGVDYSKDEGFHDQLLPNDNEEFPGYRTRRSNGSLHRRYTVYVPYVVAFAGLSALILGVYLVWWQTKLEWTSCGTTAAEARMNNCHYEPMQRSWIPDACYFNDPSLEYDPFGDRQWFADENMTILSNLTRLQSGDEEMAFTKYFHNEHCLYSWRKLAIAVEQRKCLIDSKTYDLHHTTHCARGIAKRLVDSEMHSWNPDDDTFTESPLMFQTCVELF